MKKSFFLVIFITFITSNIFSTEYSVFKKNGLYGFINGDRKVIVESKYDTITTAPELLKILKQGNFCESEFKEIIQPLFRRVGFSFNFVSKNKILIRRPYELDVEFLNLKTGRTSEDYDKRYLKYSYGFSDSIGIYGWDKLIDLKGNELLTGIVDSNTKFSEGLLALVLNDGRSGFVNKKGKFVIETTFYIDSSNNGLKYYPRIDYYFNEGYALVETEEHKWVQFTKKGKKKEVPEDIELAAIAYNSGLVPIRDKTTGKYGYMNPEFEIVIPYQFTAVESFVGPYAIVTYQEKDAIVDTKGNIYFCDEFCK